MRLLNEKYWVKANTHNNVYHYNGDAPEFVEGARCFAHYDKRYIDVGDARLLTGSEALLLDAAIQVGTILPCMGKYEANKTMYETLSVWKKVTK